MIASYHPWNQLSHSPYLLLLPYSIHSSSSISQIQRDKKVQRQRTLKRNEPPLFSISVSAAMNEKASVSKELNAKHAKILEGLLRLPENRQCADCLSKAPRWASINLGIFICMQCSGIHRSLGVHISKVRSTTLDTWLPEQVVFMQMTGNEKSNNYWEAELPPNFERTPIDNFIHAKYVDKRWASKTAMPPSEVVSTEQSCEKSVCLTLSGIPKKARKYSLGDEAFTNHVSQVPPTTRTRGASLDLMSDVIPIPPMVIASEPNTEVTQDLFSLLYVSESTQDRTVVPPSRWATFE
ncbi:probable ADP-ribosylation factor GTPase-activating protein AGD15 isoform X2 [Primulina eburnea]|uniref:probable ADP-ribosylation factor GTPase-activating protein AGD15 isoform X1 n=2 Tax=Primulina eburnea TaxID=1245227 RepID=UPI003C6C22C8